jgi:CysZ protein
MRQFATGIHDVGRGLAVLRAHPTLWRWLVAPALATLVLLVVAIAAVVHLVHPVVAWVSDRLGWVASIAGGLLTLLVAGVLACAGLLVFTQVAGMIAGPFNEQLSERIESVLTGRHPSPFSLREFAHGAALSVLHSARRISAALIGVALVFVVGTIPVIGAAAALVLAAWFTATAAAYDCYDAVFGRRAMAYRDKMAYLARHRGRTLGLGVAVAGMLLVPGLNLVALGLGAAAATVASHAQGPAQGQALHGGAGPRAM